MPVRVETFSQVEEAARALSSNRKARIYGGGTILMRSVNEGDQSFDTLFRLTDPTLKDIRSEGDRVLIGAAVTMAEIIRHRDLSFLADAARAVGGPAIRTTATIAGNLLAPPPYGDLATALVALGAEVRFAGQGSANVPIDEFMRDRESRKGSVVTAVSVPRLADPTALRFLKVTRVKPKGVALMSIAALLPRSGGRIDGFRIAYGNMGPTPLRVAAVERALEGSSLDEAGITRAAAVATEGLDPPTDALASAWYRREVAPVHLKRLLLGQTG